MSLKRFFLISLAISFALAAILGIAAVALPNWRMRGEIVQTIALYGATSLLCLCCANALDKQKCKWLMVIGLFAAIAAFLFWLPNIWSWYFGNRSFHAPRDVIEKLAVTCQCVAVVAAHVGILLVIESAAIGFRIARLVAITGSMTFAICLLTNIWIGSDWISWEPFAIAAILASTGTLLAPILARVDVLRKAAQGEPMLKGRVSVRLTCPRCGEAQELFTGASRCRACKLKIVIGLEEPTCVCGYSLFGLTGEKCPECGRNLSETERWRGPGSRPEGD
ncbi:MAG TPA: hypothetical protein VG797_05440 [Phycisphaerales bacterium]|nr:hypothetical protein [Phycisphaerales bacterium]